MFGEEALQNIENYLSGKQLLHKDNKNVGRNWQNQVFSRTLEIKQSLETTASDIIQEKGWLNLTIKCYNKHYAHPLIPTV